MQYYSVDIILTQFCHCHKYCKSGRNCAFGAWNVVICLFEQNWLGVTEIILFMHNADWYIQNIQLLTCILPF